MQQQNNFFQPKKAFRNNLNILYLMRLVIIHYIKGGASIFTDFILPIIVMTSLFSVFTEKYVYGILPGILLTPIMTSCFISLAASFNDWRSSIIFKKFRVSRISTVDLFLSFLIFYIFIGLTSFAFCFLYTFLLSKTGLNSLKNFETTIKKVNWGFAFLGIFQLIVVCISAGFLVSTFSSKVMTVIAIGLTLFLTQCFLLGGYLPIGFIQKVKPIRIITYFFPFSAPMKFFQYNWFESGDVEIQAKLKEGGEWIRMNYVKNWEVLVKNESNVVEKYPFFFHGSYWSLTLTSLGWSIFFITSSIVLSKKLRFG